MGFDQLYLSDFILDKLKALGFETPTPIQEKAIPALLTGRDFIGIAQTGTGKTLSFALPLIERLQGKPTKARIPRAIILAPTRELADQNYKTICQFTEGTSLKVALIIGGESPKLQRQLLQKGVDIIIATPGRLLDQYDQGFLMLAQTEFVAIDEADRMLDMGFIPDVEKILSLIYTRHRQVALFSATMPKPIRALADQFLTSPKEVTVTPPATTNANVEQFFVVTSTRSRAKSLERILAQEDLRQGIIFSNRKRDIDTLAKNLRQFDKNVGVLHGDIPQFQRVKTLEAFKDKEIKLLVASDVAARGLDVKGLSHVFNMEVPPSLDDYVHRIGRTGRAGEKGRAFTLIADEQEDKLQRLFKRVGKNSSWVDDRPKTKREEPLEFEIPVPLKNDFFKAANIQSACGAEILEINKTKKPFTGFGEYTPAFFSVCAEQTA